MYAYIKGVVDEIGMDYAIIEAAGVGYMLSCSKYTLDLLNIGETQKLYVHMGISQDNVTLYGFIQPEERAMFRSLISVSRIGSRIALSILSHMNVSDVAMAVATGNAAAFDPVPGMGKKTADRLLLELKEKISLPATAQSSASSSTPRAYDMRSEAIEALIALGYDGLTAGKAIGAIKDGECSTVEQMIKHALRDMPDRGHK